VGVLRPPALFVRLPGAGRVTDLVVYSGPIDHPFQKLLTTVPVLNTSLALASGRSRPFAAREERPLWGWLVADSNTWLLTGSLLRTC